MMPFKFRLIFEHGNICYFKLLVDCSSEEREYVTNKIMSHRSVYSPTVYTFIQCCPFSNPSGVSFRTSARWSSEGNTICLSWDIWNVAKGL